MSTVTSFKNQVQMRQFHKKFKTVIVFVTREKIDFNFISTLNAFATSMRDNSKL